MGEEKNVNSLLPLEMLEKIFCHLSFPTLKVKFAFPQPCNTILKMLWSEVENETLP